MSPFSSAESNLSFSAFLPPIWLIELHTKLWGKRQFFDDIFRTATLTKADFIHLQQELHSHNPERNSDDYEVQNVLAIKADFLRSRSSVDSRASSSLFDSAHDNLLVPKLVFDTTHDVSPTDDIDTTSTDVDANAMDVVPDPHSYIEKDAIYLSTGDTAIFPCTIRYMDLRPLGLTHFTRTPQLMLLRKEWEDMVDLFNKREKGIRGGAIFTGQPGIGECCYCLLPTD